MYRLALVLVLAATVTLLAVAPSGSPAARGEEESLLRVAYEVIYDVQPQGPVAVSWSVQIENNDPATTDAPNGGTIFFYESLTLPVLRGATGFNALSSDGALLPVTPGDPGFGPITTATVELDRRLFFGDTYEFVLVYSLGDVREHSLLITPNYIYFPAIASGDQATVAVNTPGGGEWQSSVEPVDCSAEGTTLACGGSTSSYIAAMVEVSRPSATATLALDVELQQRPVSVFLTYFQGEDAFAQHLRDLTLAGLPVLESLHGVPYPGPEIVRISQGGRQAVLGYEGITTCTASECTITISPAVDDVTVLHELAHLWSGLFTKRWLSEGFAQFMAEEAALRLPDLVQSLPPEREPSSASLRLDAWGEVTSIIGAADSALETERAGYELSLRFMYSLESAVGSDGVRDILGAIAESGRPADSRRFMDLVEDSTGYNPDSLFQSWVFPQSLAPVLEQRRQARDRLSELEQQAARDGLPSAVTESIRSLVLAWRFDDALRALDRAEVDLGTFSELSAGLERLLDRADALGLTAPGTIGDALASWELDEAGRLLAAANAALDAYESASARVGAPRSLWQRLGLIGKNPSGDLDTAATAFSSGEFQRSIEASRAAERAIDGASGAALLRFLIVGMFMGTFAIVVLAAVWYAHHREHEYA